MKRDVVLADETAVRRLPDTHTAFCSMVAASGLTDQQICDQLEIDKAQWSRICSLKAHFPMNLWSQLFDITGSELVLQHMLYQRGYEHIPQRRMSELERDLAAAEKRAEEAERENAYLIKLFGGKI